VLEIGCGDGSFLALLAQRGAAPCTGVDPSAGPAALTMLPPGVTIVSDFAGDEPGLTARLIVSRQVLEHLAEPRVMLARIRGNMEPERGRVFAEVPNGLAMLRDLAIWDLIYEHFSYFTPSSLSVLMTSNGLALDSIEETFDGQFLCATARHTVGRTDDIAVDPAEAVAYARDFRTRYLAKRSEWGARLAQLSAAGRKAVVWGAGSKGITFLNLFATEAVVAAIDINPRKRGMFVAGSGCPILGPDDLQDIAPDVVIVMNASYTAEIATALSERRIRGEILTA
jgi:hypothetical protein